MSRVRGFQNYSVKILPLDFTFSCLFRKKKEKLWKKSNGFFYKRVISFACILYAHV